MTLEAQGVSKKCTKNLDALGKVFAFVESESTHVEDNHSDSIFLHHRSNVPLD